MSERKMDLYSKHKMHPGEVRDAFFTVRPAAHVRHEKEGRAR